MRKVAPSGNVSVKVPRAATAPAGKERKKKQKDYGLNLSALKGEGS